MSNVEQPQIVYRRRGFCPICAAEAEFSATRDWYRDYLICSGCGSIPRERGLTLVLERRFPDWRKFAIHESSPVHRGISAKMAKECPRYVATQFYPGQKLGEKIQGYRNEDLEAQTFADETFDLVVSLDVMEHVNHPDKVMQEVARTLKPGGAYLFTVPTYKQRVTGERRALYRPDGSVEHFAEPEYHGNPVSADGSLVTFHYGYDLAELLCQWSGMDVEVIRYHDHRHGVIGEFTEVYLTTKPGDAPKRSGFRLFGSSR